MQSKFVTKRIETLHIPTKDRNSVTDVFGCSPSMPVCECSTTYFLSGWKMCPRLPVFAEKKTHVFCFRVNCASCSRVMTDLTGPTWSVADLEKIESSSK